MPATATSLTVSVSSFTATDNIGVTGYLLTETSSTPSSSNPNWSGSAPSSFTFSASGTDAIYAWAKDAAGNISDAASTSVTITLTPAPVNNSPVVVVSVPSGGATIIPPPAGTPSEPIPSTPSSSSSLSGGATGAAAGGNSSVIVAALENVMRQLNTLLISHFQRDLKLGDKGVDVQALQIYLNFNGFELAASGAGSPGHETEYFGAKTVQALIAFQKAHQLPATGYFGPATRAKVAGNLVIN
jgi:hypothetical protein